MNHATAPPELSHAAADERDGSRAEPGGAVGMFVRGRAPLAMASMEGTSPPATRGRPARKESAVAR